MSNQTPSPEAHNTTSKPARPKRPIRTATVTNTQWLSPTLIRLSFDCPELITMHAEGQVLEHTDHYVKLIFSPADHPANARPITRTYTLRNYDQTAGTFDIDFVSHGSEGLAGPWAATAGVGEKLQFVGPGGAWAPQTRFSHFVLAGDEAAAPAICAALEHLPAHATADAYIEVAGPNDHFELSPRWPNNDLPSNINIHWVERNGATHGTELSAAVRTAPFTPDSGWFIHGVAEMIRELRSYLFVEHNVPKTDASISGYWRLGMTENQWQATKKDFVQEMETREQLEIGKIGKVGEKD